MQYDLNRKRRRCHVWLLHGIRRTRAQSCISNPTCRSKPLDYLSLKLLSTQTLVNKAQLGHCAALDQTTKKSSDRPISTLKVLNVGHLRQLKRASRKNPKSRVIEGFFIRISVWEESSTGSCFRHISWRNIILIFLSFNILLVKYLASSGTNQSSHGNGLREA